MCRALWSLSLSLRPMSAKSPPLVRSVLFDSVGMLRQVSCSCFTGLLVLYYAKLVHRRQWPEYRAGLITCYAISVRFPLERLRVGMIRRNVRFQVSFMLLITVLFSGLYGLNKVCGNLVTFASVSTSVFFLLSSQSQGGQSETYEFLDRIIYFTSGCYFGTLVLLAGYYIDRLRDLSLPMASK